MNKILTVLSIALLLFASVALADGSEDFTLQQVSQCDDFINSVESATQANTTVTLATAPRVVKSMKFENFGSDEVWIDLDDGVATVGTDDEYRLDAGKTLIVSGFKTSTVGLICDTGETASVQVSACR